MFGDSERGRTPRAPGFGRWLSAFARGAAIRTGRGLAPDPLGRSWRERAIHVVCVSSRVASVANMRDVCRG